MDTRIILLLLFSLLLCIQLEAKHTINITRKQNKFLEGKDAINYKNSRSAKSLAGSTIPMAGGLLTLGAYYTAQNFTVLIDTGSSNLVVGGKGCSTCGSSFFNPSLSSSFSPLSCSSKECSICTPDGGIDNCVFGKPYCLANTANCGFGISYGGGSSLLEGYWATDKVCVGEMCVTATFGMATAEYPPNNLAEEPIEGILGLASPFNACNPTCVTTVFDSYVQKQLVSNMYSMCLTASKGGLIDFGEIVPSRYTGEINWAKQEVDRWYNIVIQDVLVGSTSLGLPQFAYATTNDLIGAFVDSGTSIVLFSPLIFSQFQTVFQSDCSLPGVCGNETLFTVESTKSTSFTVSVPPSSYLMNTGGQYCLGIAAVSGVGVVLGDVFMENYYVVFDRDNSQIGFAPIASCSQ